MNFYKLSVALIILISQQLDLNCANSAELLDKKSWKEIHETVAEDLPLSIAIKIPSISSTGEQIEKYFKNPENKLAIQEIEKICLSRHTETTPLENLPDCLISIILEQDTDTEEITTVCKKFYHLSKEILNKRLNLLKKSRETLHLARAIKILELSGKTDPNCKNFRDMYKFLTNKIVRETNNAHLYLLREFENSKEYPQSFLQLYRTIIKQPKKANRKPSNIDYTNPEILLDLDISIQGAENIKNQSLILVWPRLRLTILEQTHVTNIPSNAASANNIRHWINNPANDQAILVVKNLDLSNLNLIVLPKELSFFKNASLLSLQYNQLTQIDPSIISEMPELEAINIYGNPLSIYEFFKWKLLKPDNFVISCSIDVFKIVSMAALIHLFGLALEEIPIMAVHT